jgi:hypothetical protein
MKLTKRHLLKIRLNKFDKSKPSFIEIKPLGKPKRKTFAHIVDSGLYDPEFFSEAYKHEQWHFKNHLTRHSTPQKH